MTDGGWGPGWVQPLTATPVSARGVAAAAAVDGSPLAAMFGVPAWWGWQRHATALVLDTRPDGEPACATAVVVICRQNGKTTWLLAVMSLLMARGRSVVYTAHQRQLARQKIQLLFGAHRRRRGAAGRYRLNERLGDERIDDLRSGGHVRLATPDDAGGRGSTEDVIVIDEAAHISPAYLRAARASTLTRTHAQVLLVTSGLTHRSVDTHSARDAAVAQLPADPAARSHGILEWALSGDPGTDGVDLDDETIWERVIPTLDLPGGARRAVLRQARLEDPDDVWAREYLCVPTGLPGGGVISAARWAAVAAAGDEAWSRSAHRHVALGIAASPDQSHAAVAVAGIRTADGMPSAALLSHAAGDDWLLADTVAAARQIRPLAVVVDARSPAVSLRDQLVQAGWRVHVTGAAEMAASSAASWTMITGGRLAVVDDPALTVAARHAVRRPVGDVGWAWGRRGAGGDVSPLEAVTLAVAWADRQPRQR